MNHRWWVTRYWVKGTTGTISETPRWQKREFEHDKKEAGWKRVSRKKFREIFGEEPKNGNDE